MNIHFSSFLFVWALVCPFFIFPQKKLNEIDNESITIFQPNEYSVLIQIEDYIIRRQITHFKPSDSLGLKSFLEENNIKISEIDRDMSVPYPKYKVTKNQELTSNLYQNHNIYFMGDGNDVFEEFSFMSLDRYPKKSVPQYILDFVFQRKLSEKQLLSTTNFPFAGRQVPMQTGWSFETINDLKNEATTERMNWSIHKTLSDAQDSNEKQYERAILEAKSNPTGSFEIIFNQSIPVIFENVPTNVQKYIFLEKTKHPILKDLTTERKLITYYIATKVRGKFIACVFSFYESELYKENDLPPILSTFIKLKDNPNTKTEFFIRKSPL